MPIYPDSGNNFYSTDHWMTTCGSDTNATAPEVLNFGFLASGVRVHNTCTDVLFYNLAGCAATTVNAWIAGCGVLLLDGTIRTCGIGLTTTSTTTGAGLPTARPRVEVSAWSA